MIEALETRIAPATLVWLGATNGQWTNPSNWVGGTTPGAGDTLIFDSTSVTSSMINDTVPGAPYNLVFNTNFTYSLTGSPISLIGLNDVGAGTVDIACILSGLGGINQTGGVLTLSAANTFAGAINATGGVFRIASAVSPGTGVINLDGGTIEPLGSFSISNNFNVGAANFSILAATSVTLSGVIAGTGSVTKTGAGTLTFSNAANSFSGDLSIFAGTVHAVAAATTVDPVVSSVGNPQTGRTIHVGIGSTFVFDSSNILGLDGSTPTVLLDIEGTVTNIAGKFNTLGPVHLGTTGVLTGLGGASLSKQMYALSGDVTSEGGTISGSGANAGYHIGDGISFEPSSSPLVVTAALLNQTPANGSAASELYVNGGDTMKALGNNKFSGGVVVQNGTLFIHANSGLGAAVGEVTILDGATLEVGTSITTPRAFNLDGTANFIIPTLKTLTLSGVVSDANPPSPSGIDVTGGGKLVLSNPANTFTGDVSFAGGAVTINGVTTTLIGPGSATVTPLAATPLILVPGIESIVLSDTELTTRLVVTSSTAATAPIVPLYNISIPDGDDHIDLIQLSRKIVFGDGLLDSIPDLLVAGKSQRIVFADVNPGATLRLGADLPYNIVADETTPDTYNNHPNVTLRNVLGEGVTIDVTGDGVTMGGDGGGGLGKVNVLTWAYSGLVKTTQSVDTFAIKSGDCRADLEVDKFHLGMLTVASVLTIRCPDGTWYSKADIDGRLGHFLAEGHKGEITTGDRINSFTTTGSFSGSITAGSIGTLMVNRFVDDSALLSLPKVKTTIGGIDRIVSANEITKTVIQSATDIGKIGIAVAISVPLGSIQNSVISASGNIVGAIKIGLKGGSGYNLSDSMILAGANLGDDGEIGGTGGDSDTAWSPGKSISSAGGIVIRGTMTNSVIAASVCPGTDDKFSGPNTTSSYTPDLNMGGGMIGTITLRLAAFPSGSIPSTIPSTIAFTNIVTADRINGVKMFNLLGTVISPKIAAGLLDGSPTELQMLSPDSLLFYAF